MLGYDDARATSDPRASVLDFYESAYQAGARLAGWDVQRLSCLGGITDPHLHRHQDQREVMAVTEPHGWPLEQPAEGTLDTARTGGAALWLVAPTRDHADHPVALLAD